MTDTLRNSFTPQSTAVFMVAHAAKAEKPPELLTRTILTAHLLRALARQETIKGRIHDDSDFSIKKITERINYFRPLPRNTYSRQQWYSEAEEFLDRGYRVFADLSRIAEIERKKNDLADIGLRFHLQLAIMDTKSKENFIYPLYATDSFLTLDIAREVLRDINLETRNLSSCGITDNILFEPLTDVEKFYVDTSKKIPHGLTMRDAAPEEIHAAVVHLADLADKLQKFSYGMYHGQEDMPHAGFRDCEGVSVLLLRDFLRPYKDGRDAVVQAGLKPSTADARVLAFAPPKKRGDGIIRNAPTLAPTNA